MFAIYKPLLHLQEGEICWRLIQKQSLTLLSPVGKIARRISLSSFIFSNSLSRELCTWALVITSFTTSSCSVRLSARSLVQSNLNLFRGDKTNT